MIDLIKPEWPAPLKIKAYMTTRLGGYSESPYDSFNLGSNVGDDPENLRTNQSLLMESLGLPSQPLWLNQVHSNKIVCGDILLPMPEADGAFARLPYKICVVTTADCLPILITNTTGTIVAAIHAGWKGLASGIIENAVNICVKENAPLLVWYGAAIAAEYYEVGADVRNAFIQKDPQLSLAFTETTNQKYRADLKKIATHLFGKLGVTAIYDSELDTYSDPKHFYSYRRDHVTGRIATMIWITR